MNPALPDLATVVAAVRELPPLPAMAARVLASLGDGGADAEEIARLLGHDTALAARALRVANSPYFGLSGRVGSVQDAVVVLGLASVQALVVASALTRAFDGAIARSFDAHVFWRHSLATAAAAGELARRTGADGAALFLAGILHDMGRLALFATFPAAAEAVAAHRREGGLSWLEAEEGVLGFDHAAVGGALCAHWHFPDTIGAAVAGHHAPLEGDRWADILHAADAIAHALDLARETDAAVPPQIDGAWERLGLGWDDLRHVLAATEARFDALLSILD